ncbi:hypothetical protein PHYBOEH_010726 [Phytophthora boehmeriae]|uniref:Uncharacterized protein n=1 Tax=Phytophthora boehmeriae TaxID=109152 RepID=A0A8T1VKV2_9STRA|nr:hypothetical protein PHYBOEH_010726 [Phytophthora boehmeriae]
MSVEKSYPVTLKLALDDSGSFQSVRLLKARSEHPESILDRINKALQCSLVPAEATRTTVEIGNNAEQMILNYLMNISLVNMNFKVTDVSSQTGHGDIAVAYHKKNFRIEVKSYSKPVPMKEIDKYHRSLALAEYHGGIMIQINECGYCREAGLTTPIDLRIVDGKPSVYLTGTDSALMYPTINMFVMFIDLGQPADADELEAKRKALLGIDEKLGDLRAAVDTQKKNLRRIEGAIEHMAALSIL